MKTSYSALDTFQTCPLKYKYQEIERRKTPKRPEQVFGTVVHNALKFAFERNPLYPTVDEVIDYYTRSWNEAADKIQWTNPDRRAEEESMYFKEGLQIIQNFLKKNKPWQTNSVELESRFSAEITDTETQETHALRGVIDRIDKDPSSDAYTIIDYKTGKKMPSQEMLEDNLQLGVYALALSERWPHVPAENIHTSLYFLKHNDQVSTTQSREKLDRVKQNILTIIREIETRLEADDFPPTPGPLCDYCAFRPICPMWAHEYKSEEEKKAPNEQELSQAMREFLEIKSQEEQNKKRLAELRETITSYMDTNGLERVFDAEKGSITRTVQEKEEYDIDAIEPILKKENKWSEILKPDTKEIERIKPTLTPDAQSEMEKHKKRKQTTTLRHNKK